METGGAEPRLDSCSPAPALNFEQSPAPEQVPIPQVQWDEPLIREFPAFAGMTGPPEASGQAAGSSQPAPAGGADQTSAQGAKEPPKVNALTGMAVISESNFRPLTGSERWKLYVGMTYCSLGPYFAPVVNALALDQASGNPPQWGGRGSLVGFGRRLASRTGMAIVQGTFQAPLAALFHEDVRYIASSKRNWRRRTVHAVLFSFLTYNNQGHTTLNVASLTSYYASTAVSTAWLPGTQNPARYTVINASEQIGLSFPLNVVQEFWPEIQRHILHKH
jgi:hypothetical protein